MADVIPLHTSTDDFLTVLTHPQARMSKEWLPDGTITPYSEGKHFKPGRLRVTDLASLSAALTKLQDSPRSCVVRGRYRGEEYAAANEPEHKPGTAMRRLSVFEDTPHHWMLIEVDNFNPLGADPVLDPLAAIEEYITTLPAAFHSSGYHWQMSNSAGSAKNRDVLKAHLWFWSETAYTSAQLKAWAQAFDIDTDTSVFNPVQVHYTASPTFADGVQDPIAQRCGLVAKDRGSVLLEIPDDLPLPAAKQHKLSRLQDVRSDDPVVQALNELNLVRSLRSDGGLNIVCPRESFHSTGAGAESSTIYYLPNTGGYATGHFKCLHEGCSQAHDSDFLEAIGISVIDDFDVIEETEEVEPVENRFRVKSVTEFMTAAPMHWLIRGVLPSAALIVMYGASGSGKTFMALDLAGAIARGVPWCGHKVRKGRVIYVAAEGAGGARKRFHAYCQANDLDPDSLDVGIVDVAPNLMEKGNALLLAKAIADWHPDVCLIILDTFAQVMAGGNENSGEDVGKALGNCKILNRVIGCPVMLLHHSGKDESRGARGWSGLKAAADAELEVLSCDGDHVMTVTKMKDGDDRAEYPFRLDIIDLGQDLEGDLGDRITSCVVEHCEGASSLSLRKKLPTMKPVEVALYNALSGRAVPGTLVSEAEVIALAVGNGLEAAPSAVATAFKRLASHGRITREKGAVSIPAPLF